MTIASRVVLSGTVSKFLSALIGRHSSEPQRTKRANPALIIIFCKIRRGYGDAANHLKALPAGSP